MRLKKSDSKGSVMLSQEIAEVMSKPKIGAKISTTARVCVPPGSDRYACWVIHGR